MVCCTLSTSDYQPALSLVSFIANFYKRLSTFNYSFQESCSLYPRCTSYFSVEHTVSPQSVVSNTSSGCSVEYTILNLMRCKSYQSIATTLFGNQKGNIVVVGDTVMLSEPLQSAYHGNKQKTARELHVVRKRNERTAANWTRASNLHIYLLRSAL